MEGSVRYGTGDKSDPEVGQVLIQQGARASYDVTGSGGSKREQKGMLARFATSVWNPRLDSKVLEQEHRQLAFPLSKRRFRLALYYTILSAVAWGIFFVANGAMSSGNGAAGNEEAWWAFAGGCALLVVTASTLLGVTFARAYERFVYQASITLALLLCGLSLLGFVLPHPAMSRLGLFSGSLEILLILYSVIPLPLYICLIIGGVYSILFEALSAWLENRSQWPDTSSFVCYTIGRVLLQICIHMLGIHFSYLSHVRERKTFLKVGQSMLLRRDLEAEKDLKKKMINSLMPEQVANNVISSREEGAAKTSEDEGESSPGHRGSRANTNSVTFPKASAKIPFRSFHMSQMENTSILFADIVGFTKMSSNKTAEHLVSLLNDLFGRFDVICAKSGCEKICTLGDCYYCVSGCPQARPDHAQCCVEMGLGMVIAIDEFDRDHNEAVGMRVGVHTGSVLCGIVGTRRFKFDVWSHDVTIANMMESEGKAGMVHISDTTYELVKHLYNVEPGEEITDIRKHKTLVEYYNQEKQAYDIKHIQDEGSIKTWFILSRKSDTANGGASKALTNESTNSDYVTVALDNNGQASKVENGEAVTADDTQTKSAKPQLTLIGESVEDKTILTQHWKRLEDKRARDQDIVQCMRKDSQIVEVYLHRPPINGFTLNFRPAVEGDFRHKFVQVIPPDGGLTLTRWSAAHDLIVGFIFFILVSVCCFLNFRLSVPWIVLFVVATVSQLILIVPQLGAIYGPNRVPAGLKTVGQFMLGWYPRHLIGAFLVSVPIAAVYSNFSCIMFAEDGQSDLFYALALTATLLHFCNITVLSSWMKSSLATIGGVVLLLLIALEVCAPRSKNGGDTPISDNITSLLSAVTDTYENYITTEASNITTLASLSVLIRKEIFAGQNPYEIILVVGLLLVLIWFLNREFETSCRLSYHGDAQARIDQQKMQEEKEQADWLLHNIIPEHVSNVLKKTSQYCKNHHRVGVVFATINNYDEFYEQSFDGGKEYLRVLNELMGDFEDLLDDPKYKDVEKIKTIGACLMVASGLNPATLSENTDPHAHLYALLDFARDLLQRLEAFNAEIFNFNFTMKIGFNFGEVTAGVIGTTKLLYDIWGDTVNVSSRMYSTGKPGRIQLTAACMEVVKDKFEFEYRGKIAVKGKGELDTYLLVDKKPGATWS